MAVNFVRAQFSIKYEPKVNIRRSANEIEDFLREHYGIPQTVPIPDEVAPDAPRIILYSKNGHSQIHFSQISTDFTVKFDNEYMIEFEKTKDYIQERAMLIINLLENIGITDYFFCGISYNARLDIGNQKPIEYMKKYLADDFPKDELYEASQNTATVRSNKYFINQQIGTYKEFQGRPGANLNLLEIRDTTFVSEGVSLAVDINNRYRYVYQGEKKPISECRDEFPNIFSMLEEIFNEWR